MVSLLLRKGSTRALSQRLSGVLIYSLIKGCTDRNILVSCLGKPFACIQTLIFYYLLGLGNGKDIKKYNQSNREGKNIYLFYSSYSLCNMNGLQRRNMFFSGAVGAGITNSGF